MFYFYNNLVAMHFYFLGYYVFLIVNKSYEKPKIINVFTSN